MSVKRSEGYEPDFDLDLAFGAAGEKAVEELFANLEAGHKTIEVKNDRRTLDTGNLFIECKHKPRGHSDYKPSGIQTSEADIWAFVIGLSIIIAPTAAVLWLARNHRHELIGGGEKGDNPTKGVLIKVQAFLEEINESPFT